MKEFMMDKVCNYLFLTIKMVMKMAPNPTTSPINTH